MTKTPAIIFAYLTAMTVLAAAQMLDFFGQGVGVAGMRKGIECYIWMTALQFFLILIVGPALSAGSIAGERERQTFDLLLVTGAGTRKIILGKLSENFAFLALLILCSMPVMALPLVTGGITGLDILMTQAYLIAIALAVLCVGMITSVLCKRTLAAVILAYLLILVLGGGTWILAKRGPIAAAYTYDSLAALAGMSDAQIIRSLPVTILLNPAVGLVMLLAGQTGILHRTMEYTMRLYHIYSACKLTGFSPVAYVILGAILLASTMMIALACVLLHMQTGARQTRGRKE